jgi:hypothetical protein
MGAADRSMVRMGSHGDNLERRAGAARGEPCPFAYGVLDAVSEGTNFPLDNHARPAQASRSVVDPPGARRVHTPTPLPGVSPGE